MKRETMLDIQKIWILIENRNCSLYMVSTIELKPRKRWQMERERERERDRERERGREREKEG